MGRHLEVINLSKIFNMHILGGKKITGFENINFSLNRGEFLGIAGKSGYGKSSLVKCIYRNYEPTSGKILLYDELGEKINLVDLTDYEMLQIRKKRIGYVSQFFRCIPRVTTMNIIIEPLIDKGWEKDRAIDRAKELFKLFDIPANLHDAFPLTFSGGEKQRINLMRTLIDSPELLILDEPTASLDSKNRKIILNILKELKNQGISMIGIFHNMEELEELSDNIFHIERNSREEKKDDYILSKEKKFEFKI